MNPIKLDIGCGGRGSRFSGFIGIDVHIRPKKLINEDAEYYQGDFVYDAVLPWKDNTVSEIVATHIIEHLNYRDGQTLIKRAFALLKPGAKMYISCPDLDVFAQKLLDRDQDFWTQKYPRTGKEMWPGDTIADRFNYHFSDATHIYQYNQESLINAVIKAGCSQVDPLPKDHQFEPKPHEIGVVITK